jgi:hypothetical protein
MNNTKNSLPPVSLLLDSARGVYIPQNFCEQFDLSKWQGIAQSDIDCILSKDEGDNIISPYDIECYWDAWQAICDNATFTENGNTWRLYQDGDLWAICYEIMSDEERSNFDINIVPYEYYINLDEKGEFYADVRNNEGFTIFEFKGYWMFEDGHMSDKDDTEGLLKYLQGELILTEYDEIVKEN